MPRAHTLSRTAAVVILLALTTACAQRRQEKLTVYCGVSHAWCELLGSEFEKRTGVHTSVSRKGSGETLAQIRAERRNPRGDVWFGGTGDGHLQAAAAGLTEPYLSPRVSELWPWAQDPAGNGEHRTTGVYMGALGFAYNSQWLSKKGLPAPKRWADLVDPRYRGEVQMANPEASGTAYTALATISQLFGEARAFDYLKALDRNINQYTQSGAAPVSAAARGETGIAIVFLHDALVEKTAGFPIELVPPEEGTGYEIGCVSIIRGARHLENAKRFVDWVLSPEGQAVALRAKAFQFPSNKASVAPPGVPPSQLHLIDLDYKKLGEKTERERLLRRWEQDVRGQR